MDGCDNGGLVGKDNILGGVLVTGVGKETPVNIGSVTDIWVIVLSGGGLKNTLHQTLGLLGPLKEELDDCSEDL